MRAGRIAGGKMLTEEAGFRVEACDSWSLGHLGYLYPGTAPVMIKLDHNRSCPWV